MQEKREWAEQEYHSYRKELTESLYSQSDSYDKYMLLLSGGSFGVTIAVIGNQNLFGQTIDLIPLLILSWSFFGLSMLITLISFLLSQFSHSKIIDELDEAFSEKRDLKPIATKHLQIMSILSMLSFISALIFIIIFISTNLGS